METTNITPMGLTIEAAAAYSCLGVHLVRRLVKQGKLPALRVGKRIIVKRDVLDRFLDANLGIDLLDGDSVKAVMAVCD